VDQIKKSDGVNSLLSQLDERKQFKCKTLGKRVRQTESPPSNRASARRDKVATTMRIFEGCPSAFTIAGQRNIERTMTPQRSLDENMAGLRDGMAP
jgi:hypothetical protein